MRFSPGCGCCGNLCDACPAGLPARLYVNVISGWPCLNGLSIPVDYAGHNVWNNNGNTLSGCCNIIEADIGCISTPGVLSEIRVTSRGTVGNLACYSFANVSGIAIDCATATTTAPATLTVALGGCANPDCLGCCPPAGTTISVTLSP